MDTYFTLQVHNAMVKMRLRVTDPLKEEEPTQSGWGGPGEKPRKGEAARSALAFAMIRHATLPLAKRRKQF